MTLAKGWINRQFARVERDAKKWPDWMKRETDLRAQDQAPTGSARTAKENEGPAPGVKKADGA